MIRRTFVLISALILCELQVEAHTNIVGRMAIEDFDNELIISATLEKRHLTLALMNEGDCAPKNMLSICGSEYVQNHVQLLINGSNKCLKMESVEVQKENVVFKYTLDIEKNNLETISVKSDYMLDYHEHSVLRVGINIAELSKSYDMKSSRKKINISL